MRYRRKTIEVEAGTMPQTGLVTIEDVQVEVQEGDYLFFNEDGSISGFAAKAHFEDVFEVVPDKSIDEVDGVPKRVPSSLLFGGR